MELMTLCLVNTVCDIELAKKNLFAIIEHIKKQGEFHN